MSLRNFVPSYPQLSVNGPPPPHHQTHRTINVSVATALQQQISQQQAAAAQQQQQQAQGAANSNQNNGGNVQTAPSHEYHMAQCIPFQTPAGANLAQNYIRHMSNGGYAPGHPQPQAIYQTQGGPPGVVQNQQPSQSNQAQSLSNQQNQARLTPMTQPTAPPTPPTQQQQQQQQQQQSQQAPQYAVQLQQTGLSGAGNARAPQYRSQNQVPRRQPQQPQQINQPLFYQQYVSGVPYSFVIPPGAQIRAPAYGHMPFQQVFNNYATAAPSYGQMAAPSNGQQRQSTPQPAVPAMPPQQANEYSGYPSMDVGYPPVMQAPPVATQAPPPPQQKTVKKTGNKAILIINPLTGKSIFDDDSSAPAAGASSTAGSSIATVDKAITASHNELNKDEAVEKEAQSTAEPLTPVVSAMSDGPSVDITPKHQVNKIKKIKPPELVTQPVTQPSTTQIEPLPTKPSKAEEKKPEFVASIPKDNENNNVAVTPTVIAAPAPAPVIAPVPVPVSVPAEPVIEIEVVKVVKVAPVQAAPLDVNDTNNNNYQKVTELESGEKNLKETPQVTKELEATPQDTNNNSTDDKAVMTSPSIRQSPSMSSVPDKEKDEKLSPEAVRKVSNIDGPIEYVDGQWSPANLAGKKYYTRDQLLKLKDQPIAGILPPTQLPENVASSLLKNNREFLTSTLNQTMPLPGMGGSGMQRGVAGFDPINSLTPKFMNPPMGGGRNPYPKRPSQQGNKQQMAGNGRGSQAGIIKLTLSLQDDVKLNEAQNAWKPSHLVKKQDMTEEERVTHDLLSRFRSMLNKLTAENFGYLVQEVKTYKIDTSERLDGIISLVFEKAISEPKFAPTYANLCKEVSGITTAPTGEGPQGRKNTLKAKLITQCQKEFERHREESIVFNDIEEKLKEIENLPEHERRGEEKAHLEEEHYRVRQRANGTVKFIGELFKIDMLTSKIMRACIDMLLQEYTEEKIERVCKLLTTIGGKMEEQDGRSTLDKYFSQLNEMLHPAHKIIKSSRIKFEIQNLEDLRTNGWKARRQDMTPRTMGQIQQEAEQEQQMINYQTRQNARDDRNRGGNQGGYNNNNNNRRQQQTDNDGWQTPQPKSRMPALQFSKISLPTMNSEGPKLGAPTDFQKFMVNSNKFSALPVDTEIDNAPARYGGSASGSKNNSMERGADRGSRFYTNGGSNTSDGRYSGRSSGSNQGSRNNSQIRSRDNSDGRGGPSRSLQAPPRHNQAPPSGGSSLSFSGAVKQPQKTATPSMPAEPMSQDDIDKNYKEMLSIVNKFRDDKLTLDTAIEALESISINKDVVVEMYNKFLDRKDIDRENLMMVICEMLKTNKMSRDDNRAALIDTMEMAPDMLCDVPRTYEYIGQFYAELLIASVITFQDVYKICETYMKSSQDGGDKMLRFIFTAIEKRHGAPVLQQVVADANCDLGQFVTDGNFNKWLEANKFTNTVRHGTRGTTDVMVNVKKLLEEKKKNTAESIVNYINSTNSNIDASFIRQLTTAVIENCCEEFTASSAPSSYKLQNHRLEHLLTVLLRCIDNDKALELQCIYALQNFAFMREYPSGLLNSTFEILYENDVLSLEAFEKWKNCEDSSEDKICLKGVAICSTKQFFTKLEEDKDDDEYGDDGDTL